MVFFLCIHSWSRISTVVNPNNFPSTRTSWMVFQHFFRSILNSWTLPGHDHVRCLNSYSCFRVLTNGHYNVIDQKFSSHVTILLKYSEKLSSLHMIFTFKFLLSFETDIDHMCRFKKVINWNNCDCTLLIYGS